MDPLQISPLAVQSLKEACVRKLEGFILSGELKIGERLPAERALAQRLGLSRPVLHEALVDLAGKGLVVIEPRRGARIADFRTSGSLALLPSLLAYQEGALDPVFMNSLMEMRLVLEMETARLAAPGRAGLPGRPPDRDRPARPARPHPPTRGRAALGDPGHRHPARALRHRCAPGHH